MNEFNDFHVYSFRLFGKHLHNTMISKKKLLQSTDSYLQMEDLEDRMEINSIIEWKIAPCGRTFCHQTRLFSNMLCFHFRAHTVVRRWSRIPFHAAY